MNKLKIIVGNFVEVPRPRGQIIFKWIFGEWAVRRRTGLKLGTLGQKACFYGTLINS
jgi:hypothetical protein